MTRCCRSIQSSIPFPIRGRDSGYQIVQDIAKRYEGKLAFKYTGPFPPYNFVTIRLQLERSTGV